MSIILLFVAVVVVAFMTGKAYGGMVKNKNYVKEYRRPSYPEEENRTLSEESLPAEMIRFWAFVDSLRARGHKVVVDMSNDMLTACIDEDIPDAWYVCASKIGKTYDLSIRASSPEDVADFVAFEAERRVRI